MRRIAMSLFLGLALGSIPAATACAGVAEARDVARQNNCAPKKIDVVSQAVGLDARTVYRVSCTAPKTDGDQGAQIDAVLVACTGGLCSFLRGVPAAGGR